MSFLPANSHELFQGLSIEDAEKIGSAGYPVLSEDGELTDESPAKRTKTTAAAAFPIVESPDTFSEEVEQKVPAGETTATPLSLSHQVRHEVAIPDGYAYVPLSSHRPPETPARQYRFILDPFQKLAIACIERAESVLVSAHTSAGKTVVAEYAIAVALREHQRVIYTSPIKALSNQKYRELQETFGDVGLMTGDVTINQDASCLVMTTEILRSMLYRGSEVMREVSWVVFDEIHYMRDKERGVVWEETLILLPDTVKFVFLSATIPNALQFARWICKNHSQPCHVVYTNYRPTPLQHYLFPAGGDGIHLVVDEKAIFREQNFQKALCKFAGKEEDAVLGEGKTRRSRPKQAGNGGAVSDIYKIIRMITMKNYQPVIVFSFSRRECETNAIQLTKLDFNSEDEKKLVTAVFKNAIDALSEEDRTLPQIENILPMLRRGVGIHHSGLLPILKEVIEILFQEGLLKVLFATETFSIGLNMPARTVVFTNARKFDGQDFRWLSSGEYIQMSGRAGRRGLDDRGIVILMVEERMEPAVAKRMLKGDADALNSAFHLSYNMILNLMRVEGVSPEYMLAHSFFQFQSGDAIPALELQMKELETKADAIMVDNEKSVAEYYNIRKQLDKLGADFRAVVHHHAYALPFLQPGRLVRIRDGSFDFGWCAIVNVQKKNPRPFGKQIANAKTPASYIVQVLAHCAKPESAVISGPARPCPPGGKGEARIVPVVLDLLDGMSKIRAHMPKDLCTADNRNLVLKSIAEVCRRFPDGIPLLDPIHDLGIKDEAFVTLVHKIEKLESAMHASPLYGTPALDPLYKTYAEKVQLGERAQTLKKHIRNATAVIQMEELKARKRVLRRLGFTSTADVIELKGRVACEISTGDELLLTELMFTGAFNELLPEQIAALLSCFVFEEKSEDTPKLKEELAAPLRAMHEIARRIARVTTECKLPIDEEAYVSSFKAQMMDVVYAWCKGASFARICKMTDIFEGSIIRAMRRLEELLRQMTQAAKTIGNSELENKFGDAITKLKRDIVFANSLYL